MNDKDKTEDYRRQNPSTSIFYDVILLTFDVLLLIVKIIFFVFKSLYENLRGVQERDVSNDIVLITGTGHGIGKELALQYSQLGSTVVCWDVNETSNKETVELIKSTGCKAHGFTVDVTNREQVLEVGSKVLSEIGNVTILVNNAGIMPQRLMLSHSADVIKKMYEINVLSHHWMFEAFLPKMMEKNCGHIVALSSIAGLIGFENIVPYCGAKFAVRGTMESLREELRKDGRYSNIKFTTVFPYMVDTGLCKVVKLRFQNFLKLLNPRDVASAIVSAQRKGTLELTVPRYMYYLNAFIRNFPRESQDTLKDFFDSGIQAEC